jgi:hypothetical protein
MKSKITLLALAMMLNFVSFAQFFDTVPFIGAFGPTGSTKPTTTGYNPDPTNTNINWTAGWAEWDPINKLYPGDAGWAPTSQHPATTANKVTVSGAISSNTTWTNNNWYEVSGTVHILSGATLTIEPGTVIRGKTDNIFVLIVAKGGKINAVGTKEQPIVFTSGRAPGARVRGDWGGMLLIGNAHTNTANGVRQYEALPSDPLALYGGGPNYNDADNSGALRYVRIEFAGYNFLPDQEINGITFAGVGKGTKADYIMVSYANDDSYEWYGGAIDHKYLIAFAGTDDDFDMDEGYNGRCQFLLGVRHPSIFETSPTGTSNGFEHDNNTGLGSAGQVTPGVNAPTPTTAPIISNMTLLGPIRAGENRNALSTTARARFGRALEIRTNVSTSVFNSLIGGYLEGMRMVHPSTSITPSVQERALSDQMTMRNNVLAAAIPTDVLYTATNTPSNVNTLSQALYSENFTSPGTVAKWWFQGATSGFTTSGNDTANNIAKFGITSPSYTGNPAGAASQISFTGVNYLLTAGNPYATAARFNTAKIPTTPQPFVNVTPSSLPVFNQTVGAPSALRFIVVNAGNLVGNVNFNLSTNSNFEISFSHTTGWATSLTKNGPTLNDTVFIRYNRANTGANPATLNIASTVGTDFAAINLNLQGSATAPASPVFGVDKSLIKFSSAVGSPSTEQLVNVFARYLSGDINVAATGVFQVSTTSGSGFGASVTLPSSTNGSTPIYVRFNPSSAGAANGTVTLSSAGLDDVIINLEGNTTGAPLISASPSGFPQWQIDTQTTTLAYPITVSGSNLTADVVVKAPNTRYKLSTDSAFTSPVDSIVLTQSGGSVASTKVYVRFQPGSNLGSSTGNVSVASTGATTRNVAVSGLATSATARRITVVALVNSWSFETIFGTPSTSRNFRVSAARLTDRLTISFGVGGFQLSLNNTTWSDQLVIDTLAGGNINETIVYLRYNPATVGASGAQQMNLTSASATTITFTVSGISTPVVTVDPPSLPELVTTVGTPSYTASVNVSGVRLLGPVTIDVTPGSGFEVSSNPTSGFGTSVSLPATGNTLSSTPVYFRYNPTSAGQSPAGTIATFATTSSPSALINLSGYAVDLPTPVLNLSTATLTFNATVAGPTAAQTFTVQGTNLRDSLNITVGGDFELSPDSANGPWLKTWRLPESAVATALTLYCRFNRSTDGTSNSNITFTSTGMTTQNIAVTGTLATVGLNDANIISNFVMYPNPASDLANLLFTLEKASNVNVVVSDITGKVVSTFSNMLASGENLIVIPTTEMNNGIYFVKISTEQGSKTTRLMIAK